MDSKTKTSKDDCQQRFWTHYSLVKNTSTFSFLSNMFLPFQNFNAFLNLTEQILFCVNSNDRENP